MMSLPRLKHLVELRNDRADEFDREVRYVGLENIAGHTGTLVGTDTIAPEGQCAMFKKGDVLYSKLRPYLNKGFIAPFDGVASTELLPLVPSSKIDSAFLLYWLLSQRVTELINGSTFGSKMPRANWSFIGDLVPPKHDLPTQRAIARYLDARTARIDALIARKQRLLDLLAERRAALITRAVTRGLDPAAPTYDSGVEWLGEIPKGWEVKRLRYLGLFQNGINIGREAFGSGFPFISYGDTFYNPVLPADASELVESSELDRVLYSVKSGDVFFTRTSETVEDIAQASVCFKPIPDAVFAGFLIRFRPSTNKIIKEFSRYYFRAAMLKRFFVKEMNIVTRASLSQGLLGNLPVALPPIDQQKQIVDYLDQSTSKIDALILKVNQTVSFLQEYRSALITAAVSGEVEVPQPD